MTTLVSGRAKSITLPDDETSLARNSSQMLASLIGDDSIPLTIQLANEKTGERIETTVPGAALRLFAEILATMADGNPVMLIPMHAELSTQQAADLMGVSRPYFVKLLDEGEIPFRRVGEQRRVKYQDLQTYLTQYQKEAGEALDELTADGQRAGLYE